MSRLTTGLLAVVLAVIAAGALFVIYDSLSAPVVLVTPGTMLAEQPLTVTIRGAVNDPGTYELSGDARLVDAIAAAGGTRADADLAAFNPARRIADEEVIELPSLATATAVAPAAAGTGTGADIAPAASQLDINTADAAALDALPGIGPVIAERIVAYRTANGPFAAVDELARVEGISSTMVDELRPRLTAGE